jgi:hypothetical protein
MSATDTIEATAPEAAAVSVTAVRSALDKLQSALTQSILLGQRPGIKDEPLHEAAKREGTVAWAAAAYIAARDEFNRILLQQVREAQAEANEVVWPYLSQLFGAPMPGKVTFPSDCGMHPITERVVGLESLHERNGEVSGTLRTSSDDGRSHDTRCFFTRGSAIYFADHVSI